MCEVTSAKVLLIGAGGIGCELIKNLALMRVPKVTIVDMDTVDVSNLNRQFLFRRRHVGKPKAAVAAEAAKKLFPLMDVDYMYEHVKKFDHSLVSGYDVVMSALDNVDARRHLNRICLAANRPLIEAGSTGYMGQSRVIIKNVTECYECQKKEAPKIYPVCTIRSAPTSPIHCIQWGKLLYELLFGPSSDESSIIQDMHIQADSPVDYLRHLFVSDISSQCELKDKWIGKIPPIPLDLSSFVDDDFAAMTSPSISTCQQILPLKEYIAMFVSSVGEILTNRKDLIGQLSFTKDDPVAVDFVAAASILRMHNYHIPLLSRWDVESIAGAIVPAIATTNAIVAGLQCFNLINVLNSSSSPYRDLWIRYPYPTSNGSIVQSSAPSGPNPDCFICQSGMVTVGVADYSMCSLSSLASTLARDIIGNNSLGDDNTPSVFSLIMNGNLIFDSLEDDEDIIGHYSESLSEWGFDESAQMIQLEDSTRGKTFHVTIRCVGTRGTSSDATLLIGVTNNTANGSNETEPVSKRARTSV